MKKSINKAIEEQLGLIERSKDTTTLIHNNVQLNRLLLMKNEDLITNIKKEIKQIKVVLEEIVNVQNIITDHLEKQSKLPWWEKII